MKKKTVIIVGGGISGLAAAWYLQDRYDVILFEKEARLGGWIRSETIDGFLFEKGPRSLRFGKTYELARDLKIENEIIFADKAARKRFLYSGGKLRNAKSFIWRAVPSLMTEWLKSKGDGDESIKSFIKRRFNPFIAETLMDSLTSGIFAGDIEKLSMKSCFPSLYEMEQRYGSLTKGLIYKPKSSNKKGNLFTFKGGMESLVKALEKKLTIKTFLSSEINRIEFKGDKPFLSADMGTWEADHVILALPAEKTARLLEKHDPSLSETLNKIQNVSIAVVNIGFQSTVLREKGFGYLIPSKEKESILGVVFDSSAFPHQNASLGQTRLTVMIGGAHMKNFNKFNQNDFIQMALKALQKHLSINQMPDVIDCMIAKEAIPQYTLGHHDRLQVIKKRLLSLSDRIHLTGNSFFGVSVNDCISHAESLSNSLF